MLLSLVCASVLCQDPVDFLLWMDAPRPGPWHAWLETPLGRLPFELEIALEEESLTSTISNGSERIVVPETRRVEFDGWNDDHTCLQSNDELPVGDGVVLEFPHYDARIVAVLDADRGSLRGDWFKRIGPSDWQKLPFEARAGAEPRFDIPDARHGKGANVLGRWKLLFAKNRDPSVAILRAGARAGEVEGTILTTTGDYRYLAGTFVNETLLLSCFDGAHAFLLTGRLQDDGTLVGTFVAGAKSTDTWTAERDEKAQLPDETSHARWNDAFGLAQLQYPDLDGKLVSLGDARFAGKVRILQVAGSWCPNCQDETALLAQLDRKYRDKGLDVTALCFEVTGSRDRDAEQARKMLARHEAEYGALLAGRSDKALAQQALPALDRVFAFPITVFLHRDGRVRAVHAGFSGPATGAEHERIKKQFESLVEELLAEPVPKASVHEQAIVLELWRDERDEALMELDREKDGTVRFVVREIVRPGKPFREEPLDQGVAVFDGATVRLGAAVMHYDKRARVLLDPRDVGHRFTPGVRSPFPVVDGTGYSGMQQIVEGLSSQDAVRRRESVFYLALQLLQDRSTPVEYGGGQLDPALGANIVPLLADADPQVRATACWAAGVCELTKSAEALEKNLDHGFAPVRREAARALGALKHVPATSALEKLADGDIDPLVRARAAESAALFGKK